MIRCIDAIDFGEDKQALEVPRHAVSTVVGNGGLLGLIHDVPFLVAVKSALLTIEGDHAWGGLGAPHLHMVPLLFSCSHIVDSVGGLVGDWVLAFTITESPRVLLAVREAVVEWIVAFHDVPTAGELLLVDLGDGVGWVAAGGIVEGVGVWEGQAAGVNEHASDHGVNGWVLVRL